MTPISRATAFRWQARFRTDGDAVFQEQRHGHAWLVTPPVQDRIAAYCQAHPHTPSHALKLLLAAELDCTVSGWMLWPPISCVIALPDGS